MSEREIDRPPDSADIPNGGEEVVLLEEEDISAGFRLCEKSLLGRIFADRSFSVGTMESAMGAIWFRPVGLRVADLEKWKDGVSYDDEYLRCFPLWVQFWGLPEQFKILEIGLKLARRIGETIEVDLFEVKGRENQIVKARVNLNGLNKIRDSLRLAGPNLDQVEVGLRYERVGIVCLYCAELGHTSQNCQTLLEDSQQNRVRQEALGEWIKADQVGRRVSSDEFKNYERNASGRKNPGQPEKKPPPDWLADSLSKLNLKENGRVNNRMKGNQAEQMATPNKSGRQRIKQVARQKGMGAKGR
ncbi:hypothetical protein PIB30_066628 [Stylosanthes scabra]|uniref:CCHC-type domain-containing protein n=1 Tax=Stylosanthes scabra TaxID=79078 RepID=A0ABU6WQC7_9FABA|nr:hypothetical protein [Stylosanthes scabra]